MPGTDDKQLIAKLAEYDTPSITNVVAAYPGRPFCLELFNPWTTNWYTDHSVRCMFPELGRTVGYAVTCVFGLPDPNYSKLSFMDVLDALDASKRPSILVIEQRFPPEIAGKVGLAGENMATALMALDCNGIVSNGPSRDLPEVREMGFQYLISGASAGHGDQAVHAINTPVSVAGMDVAPGQIVHMDANGAVVFPADQIEPVLENLAKIKADEEARIAKLKKAKSAKELRAIFKGQAYGDEK